MNDQMSMGLPPLGWHIFLTTWQFRPGWTAVAVVLVVGYLVALRRGVRRTGTRVVHPVRVASFLSGAVLIPITLSSAIAGYSELLFWMHMIGHLVLIMVIPALLVCGHPLTVLKAGLASAGFDRALESRTVQVLTHPVVGILQYGGVLIYTHLTNFMDQMMRHVWLAEAEHALYLVSGYLFLLPLLGSEPIRTRLPRLMRIFLLMVGMLPDTIVGIVLLQADHPLFPLMARTSPSWGPGAVADINLGGALMWVVGDGLMMFYTVGLVIALISAPDRDAALGPWLESVRRQTLRDHVGESGSTLDETTDVDSDEAALAAYNQMLARLESHEQH